MNIEKANCIPMSEILEKLERKAIKTGTTYDWYLSPLRAERTASFQVNKKTNKWKDFGSGQGGDVVNLICEYLKVSDLYHTVPDALRWIENMVGRNYKPNIIRPKIWSEIAEDKKTFELLSVGEVEHFGLKNYLASRGITLNVAFKYLKEVHLLNTITKQKIVSLGMKNEEGGYELRNPTFKSCFGKKGITYIRGADPDSKEINKFEGSFDFLSVMTSLNGKQLNNDTIVLHSTSMLQTAYDFIRGFNYEVINSWLDNDKAGDIATENVDAFCTSQGMIHNPMRHLYPKDKDVNLWHMRQLKLK
jgi:hypothetical protein